jgi:hypothetical protein
LNYLVAADGKFAWVTSTGDRPIGPGHQVLPSVFGRSEYWLQDWIAENLSQLGLGPVTLVHQEQTQSGGHNLDLFAAADGTYYSIEVQLDEVLTTGFAYSTTGPTTSGAIQKRPMLRCSWPKLRRVTSDQRWRSSSLDAPRR